MHIELPPTLPATIAAWADARAVADTAKRLFDAARASAYLEAAAPVDGKSPSEAHRAALVDKRTMTERATFEEAELRAAALYHHMIGLRGHAWTGVER